MDLAIIGAGPVGLFAAFQAGLLGLKPRIIDSLEFVGGQCAALYPDKPIYDIPAHPSILAADLVKNLEKQARHFDTVFHLGVQVERLTKIEGGFILHTLGGNDIKAKAILIAAGSGLFSPNKPKLEGLEKHEGKSIFYSVKDKNYFKGKKLAIFGGGDSAIDWTVEFVDFASKVTLVHRREEFVCTAASLDKIRNLRACGKLDVITSHKLVQLKGDELTHLVIEDTSGSQLELEADCALFFFGASMMNGPMALWGLDLDRKMVKVDQSTMATNISGIYAAGDIVSYSGKLKLISVGFGEAAIACHSIQKYLNPDKKQVLVHSTSQAELFNETRQ